MKINKLLFLLIFVSFIWQISAQVSLNELKAAYIEKFTKFIEWPDSTLENQQSFVIGYYELDEFMEIMKLNLSGKDIQDKQCEFVHIKTLSDAYLCDLVYIPTLSTKVQKEIYKSLKNEPILLIGHSKNYAKNGVHINFYLEQGKLKFEINPESLKNSGLKSSYLLLKLARIVELEGGKA